MSSNRPLIKQESQTQRRYGMENQYKPNNFETFVPFHILTGYSCEMDPTQLTGDFEEVKAKRHSDFFADLRSVLDYLEIGLCRHAGRTCKYSYDRADDVRQL